MNPKKIFIISGEASGDLHGSNLVKEMLQLNAQIEIQGWGGELMEQYGVQVLKHYKELAFMGFSEVLKNINTIRKNFSLCKLQINLFKPDAIVFIDYPGFNLRMAKWAKENGYTTVYYISPQIWAWKESRIHTIKKMVDKMMVILPFENDFYAKWNYPVTYVGHPLVKVVKDYKAQNSTIQNNDCIALLPGSRLQEIKTKLPVMLSMAKHFPNYKFIIAKAPGIPDEFYEKYLEKFRNVDAVRGNTYALLCKSKAALVTSGTATLETALFKVPQVVCYKGNKLSYAIAKKLVKIKFISLVNLIMNKEVVKELIQNDFNENKLKQELEKLLSKEYRDGILNEYNVLEELLTQGGDASKKAAKILLEFLR